MKNFLILIFFIAFQPIVVVNAQNYNTSEIVTVEGQKYILHKVEQGETIFSICKKYNVEQKKLVLANPQLIFGLKQGDALKIPYVPKVNREPSKGDQTSPKTEFIYHVVKKSETIYSISKQYNVPISSICQFNPEAENELLENEIIRIPKHPKKQLADKMAEGQTGKYFMHRVESGDTFYSYKRRFGVSKEQLVSLNPELNDGLLAGLMIKIPAVQIKKVEVVPVNADDFISHPVESGETLYSISKQYGIKIFDIKELNPELKIRGLIAGETIYLPKNKETSTNGKIISEPDTVRDVPEVIFDIGKKQTLNYRKEKQTRNDDTFRISMFLPLFFDKNDTFNMVRRSDKELEELDSLKRTDPKVLNQFFKIETDSLGMVTDTVLVDSLKMKTMRSLYPPSKPFVSFYEGFLLALDSMQRAGVKVRLNLYDSKFNGPTVDSILLNNNLINADLIIGPVDVKLQKAVSDFSFKNQIPMVSPLSPNDELLHKNPFYFQVNPTKDYILRKTSDFIGDEFYDKNFIIMTLGNIDELKEHSLVDLVRDKFFSSGVYNNLNEVLFTEVDFTKGGNLGYWQVKKTLKPDMENVIFIPATDNINEREALLSRAINSLHVLAEEFNITLVGVSDYPRFASISTEYFHQLKLSYLTAYHIDYKRPEVNRFIKKFRETFFDEPKEYSYSFRGYDIGMYFIGAYQKFGKNFPDNIDNYQQKLLQSDFNFQRVSEMSGFMNHTLFIVNYTPDYNVKVLSTVTEGNAALP